MKNSLFTDIRADIAAITCVRIHCHCSHGHFFISLLTMQRTVVEVMVLGAEHDYAGGVGADQGHIRVGTCEGGGELGGATLVCDTGHAVVTLRCHGCPRYGDRGQEQGTLGLRLTM